MPILSKLALAATLLAGTSGAVVSAPALAASAAAATAPMLSPEVRAAVASAQAALATTPKDLTAGEAAVARVEAAARSDYERYLGQSLRLSLENARSQGRSDTERASRLNPLLDAVIANPATPRDEVGLRLFERGNVSVAARKNADAVDYYTRARAAGVTDPDLQLALVRARLAAGDVKGGVADFAVAIRAEEAAGRKAPESWYRLAIASLQKIDAPVELDEWTRMWLTAYGTPANWREAVTVFGLSSTTAAKYEKNRLDLYRLLYATKSLAGEKDYLDYAAAASATPGSVEETRTVLKEGAAAGALRTGNPAAAALQKTATVKLASIPAAAAREKAALAGKSADLARAAGDAYFSTRNFAKSAEMYRLAATRGEPDADRNNLHLGMALALAGNRAEAATALTAVAADPYRAIARLWTIYVSVPPVA